MCEHIVQKKSLAKVNLARGMFHFMILIIYTISLRVNKETKKSIKIGAVKVYDTNLIYSRVISFKALVYTLCEDESPGCVIPSLIFHYQCVCSRVCI